MTKAKSSLSQLWPTVAAIVVVLVCVSLGRWQLDRAQQREARAENYARLAKLAPIAIGSATIGGHELDYHRLSARGRWLPEYGAYLDNQVYRGQAGYFVYMPLRLDGSDVCLLVNRGWLIAGRDRAQLPAIKTPAGPVEVYGTVQLPARFKELGSTYREGSVWQNITAERFAQWSGLRLQPLIVRQSDDADDGLIRDWPAPDDGANRNRGYAFQWFAFAALACLLWGYYHFRRKSPHVE